MVSISTLSTSLKSGSSLSSIIFCLMTTEQSLAEAVICFSDNLLAELGYFLRKEGYYELRG